MFIFFMISKENSKKSFKNFQLSTIRVIHYAFNFFNENLSYLDVHFIRESVFG